MKELTALHHRAYELRGELKTIEKQIEDRVAQLTIEDKKQRDAELSVPGSKTWAVSEDPIVKDVLSE